MKPSFASNCVRVSPDVGQSRHDETAYSSHAIQSSASDDFPAFLRFSGAIAAQAGHSASESKLGSLLFLGFDDAFGILDVDVDVDAAAALPFSCFLLPLPPAALAAVLAFLALLLATTATLSESVSS